MSKLEKNKAILLCDPHREDLSLRKASGVLERLADFSQIDATQVNSAEDFSRLAGNPDQAVTVFVDLFWLLNAKIANSADWQPWRLVFLRGDAAITPSKLSADWLSNASCIALRRISNPDLPRVLQLAMGHDRCPGVGVLSDRNSEIYFEKILSLNELGLKVDRFMALLEKSQPTLQAQFFNLRQLSYAILHQGITASTAVAKVSPVVDFQITANSDRIVFAAKFSAARGALQQWLDGMHSGRDLLWHNVKLAADLTAFTELKKNGEVEIKALLSKEGDFSADREKSVLVHRIEQFLPDAIAIEAQRASRFRPLDQLAGQEFKGASSAAPAANVVAVEDSGQKLNFKLKADMLESEKNNLQALVKKKTQLIAGLNRDVSLAQRELVAAQNNSTKEIHRLSTEAEKFKGDNRRLTEKLVKLQKQLELNHEQNREAPAQHLETEQAGKDLKQSELNRRLAEGKISELNTKVAHQEEQLARLRKENAELKADKSNSKPVQAASDDIATKLREMNKQVQDGKNKEQALEKEVKRLTLKLESAEKNLKAAQSLHEKQANIAERLLDEAKKRKADGPRPEGADIEKVLKKKVEDLTINLQKKTTEFEKQSAELKRQIIIQKLKIDEITAQLTELQKKPKVA